MGQPFSARSNLAAFALPLPHQQPNMPITNALLNWPPNQPSQLHHAIGDNLPLVWPQYQPRHFSRPVQPNPPVSWTLGQQGYLTQPSPPEGSSTAGHSQLNLPWSQNQSNQPSLHRQPSSTQEYGKSILSNQQSRPLQRGDSDYQVSAAMKWHLLLIDNALWIRMFTTSNKLCRDHEMSVNLYRSRLRQCPMWQQSVRNELALWVSVVNIESFSNHSAFNSCRRLNELTYFSRRKRYSSSTLPV